MKEEGKRDLKRRTEKFKGMIIACVVKDKKWRNWIEVWLYNRREKKRGMGKEKKAKEKEGKEWKSAERKWEKRIAKEREKKESEVKGKERQEIMEENRKQSARN